MRPDAIDEYLAHLSLHIGDKEKAAIFAAIRETCFNAEGKPRQAEEAGLALVRLCLEEINHERSIWAFAMMEIFAILGAVGIAEEYLQADPRWTG